LFCGLILVLERAGVRPGSRDPFVSAKGPKTMVAVAWPPVSAGASSSAALLGSPTPAARKLATLKQCPPFPRRRLHCSASPQASYGILVLFGLLAKSSN